MEYKDYYKILGVERAADDKAIKTAFRKLARKYHPDVSKGSATKFQEVNEAYDVLSDPEKRRRYDTLGPDWQGHVGGGGYPHGGAGGVRFETGDDGGGFSDFFQSIFGNFGKGGAPADPAGPGPPAAYATSGGAAWAISTSAIWATWVDPAPRSRPATRKARSS
jgi:DnaJ-class molecular chaperone